jgi:putative tricarboxylic transport membrane protein
MQKADTIVALVILLLGIVILVDTSILGSGWGMSGPEPGFFPFYMGLGVVICSLFVLRKAFKAYRKEAPGTGKRLIAKGGLTPILWVLIPSFGMILLTELIGLHLATVIFLIFYMRVVGNIQWTTVVLVGLLLPLATFIVFDKLFLIPMPEGLWGKYLIPF